MNKLFAKIASITAGLALVAGAGVALASHADAKGVKADTGTVTMKHTYTVTGNFAEDTNVAANMGLDDTQWSVVCAKGSSNNNVGYNSAGDFRLYYNANGSNTVTVSSLSGWTITDIAMTFTGTNYSNASVTVGGSVVTGSNGEWTINSNSFVIGNANTSNVQVRIKDVVINYSTEGVDPTPVEVHDITFIANGEGVTGMPEDLVDQSGTVSLSSVVSPSRDGYKFKGWSLTSDGTVVSSVTIGSEDIELYAIWEEVTESSYSESELKEGKLLITTSWNSETYYLPTATSSGAAPAAVKFTDVSEIDTANLWNVSKDGDNWVFQNDKDEYLGNTSAANNGIRIGSTSDKWSVQEDGSLKSVTNSRYLGIYNGADWRSYTASTATNYKESATSLKYYELEEIDPGLKTLSIEGPDSVTYQDVEDFTAKDGEDIVTSAVWTTNDSTVLGVTDNGDGTATVEGLKDGSAKLIASADGYKNAEITLSVDVGTWKSLTIGGSMTKIEYKSNGSWDPTGFTVTATTNYGFEKDVTSEATWTYSPESPAESVTSVVATAHYSELSAASSAQTVSVEVVETHAGTLEDPYTVANAREAIDSGTGITNVYATGIVSQIVTAYNSTYKNVSFNISEDGTTTSDQLQAFRCKGSDSYTVDSADSVKVGATVVVYGSLKNYNGTYEFDANCQVISHEMPITDVDISFDPSVKSYEIGDTGTFVATSETSGAVITYSVDEPTILSVNETTGAFEALGLGVARVTATASAGGKEGSLYVDITVNGATTLSVSEANEIAAGVESGKTTSYYVYVEGYVAEFGTSMSGTSPRALDIMDESGNRIMVYTNINPYASFIDGLSLGDYLKVKANVQNYKGTYELTNPEKLSSSYSAWSLAFEILSETDSVCNEYDGVTDNADAIAAKWETLGGEGHYASLNSAEKAKLIEGKAKEDGTTLEQALARYDYLTAKYDLDGFIEDRAPSAGRYTPANLTVAEDSNVAIAVVAIVAVASISAIAVILIIKRRKAFDR